MMKRSILVLPVLFGLSLISYAQTDSTNSQFDDSDYTSWQFDATPYIWFAGLSSDISFRELNVPVEAEFKDILENLSFGFMMHAEARKGNFFLMGDIVYIKLEKDGEIRLTSTKTELEVIQTVAELGGGYTFFRTSDGGLHLDALGGLRYFEVDNKITTGSQVRLDRTISANDPFIGVRLMNVSGKWMNSARIDVGGFGIGSEFSWKSNIFLGYQFSDLFSIYFGVQVYGIDYEKDNFSMDMTSSGLATGFNFHF